jgi:nucleoside-diphosphate-sugar epimerase
MRCYAKVNSEKLLIIGCGDIGKRLAAELGSASYRITGLRRHPPEAGGELDYRPCDVTAPESLAAVVAEGFDVIAITMTPSERSDEGYRRAYVQTSANLIAALRKQHQSPRLILFVSSTGVYGGEQHGGWVDESTPPRPAAFSGQRLLEAEELIRASGFNHCIVRFSGIYGPDRNRLLNQVRQGRAVLSGAWTNRIHADDCAGVLAHLIERQRRGEPLEPLYIATDSHPAPMAEVVNWLAMQLKVDQARFAPEEIDPERGNKRCNNRRLLDTGYRFRYPDYRTGYGALLRDHAE